MVNDRTENRDYPLPHPENDPHAEDVDRLRAALTGVDTDIATALAHAADQAGNPHAVTPAMIGTLTSGEITSAITAAVQSAIADLVGGAPDALDTLNELAAALGNDNSYAATVTAELTTLRQRRIGQLVEWPFPVLPDHLTVADGSLLSRTTFPELWARVQLFGGAALVDDEDWVPGATLWSTGDGATTFRVPDLRDMFLRAAGIDRDLTAPQADQNKAHDHGGTTAGGGGHSHTGSTNTAGWHAHTGSTYAAGTHNHSIPSLYTAGLDHSHEHNPGTVSEGVRGGAGTTAYTHDNGNHSHTLAINGEGNHAHSLSIVAVSNHTHGIASDGGAEARPVNAAVQICVVVE